MSEERKYEVVSKTVGKGSAKWYIYKELCKSCGLCITKCPINIKGEKCLTWSTELNYMGNPIVESDENLCIACGTCARVCPDEAIRVEKII